MQNFEPILIFITVAEMGSLPAQPIAWAFRREGFQRRSGSWKKMSVSGFCPDDA
jgi:hypothetical protein